MGKPKAPTPPDPYETAGAQTGTNISTAIANTITGNMNQNTPYGSLSYDQTGTFDWTDPNSGKVYNLPTFTATQTLSPEQQAILDQTNAANLNLSTLANDQSAFLGKYLGQPVNLTPENVAAYTSDHFSDNFNRQWDQNLSSLETALANKGVGIGSSAYDREMTNFQESRANAFDDLQGNNYDRAVNAILTERNQPINEITALLSGSQVAQPQYAPANTGQIATTDIAGLINQNYNQRLSAWQQDAANRGGLLGGLFQLGGNLGAAAIMSERRMKRDIRPAGAINGHAAYTYRYLDDDRLMLGVMADEVPEAFVVERGGIQHVDYAGILA